MTASERKEALRTCAAMVRKYDLIDAPAALAIGDGRLAIVDEMFAHLVAAGWDRRLTDVRSVHGWLVVTLNLDRAAAVRAILRDATDAAAALCEQCGEPHGLAVPLFERALYSACAVNERAIAEVLLSIESEPVDPRL